MAIRKPPIYVLRHGIEVLAEYPPNARCRYWRLRLRPHRFFPNSKESGGGIQVQRSRVIMSATLGRALERNEHVHHKSGDRSDDRPENLEVLWAAEHNRHHKLGSKHSEEAKAKISKSLSRIIALGLREPPPAPDWNGRRHSEEARAKMSTTRKALIASGAIAKQIPPSPAGRKMSKETKEKIRKKRLAYWERRRKSADNHRGAG